MTETKSVKTLKKQLGAAIAMVCVAAVALGSSTYAWFVTNNNVKADNMTVMANSDVEFLEIANVGTNFDGKTIAVVSHGCALRCYLCHALGLPLERIEEIPLSQNTAVSRVIYDGCEIQVDYYDDLSHLEPKINQEVSV